MMVLNATCDRCGDTDLPMRYNCLGKLICIDCQEDLADIQADREDLGLSADHDAIFPSGSMEEGGD